MNTNASSPSPPPPDPFVCRRCGACCRREGQVRIHVTEIDAMAEVLNLSTSAFTRQYTTLSPNRAGLILRDHPTGECVFLQTDNTCRIHDAKPDQCRGFPRQWQFPGYERLCFGMKDPP